MTFDDERRLDLGALSQRCADETVNFFRRLAHDPRFCFELFRRALVERNPRAWDRVYAQYARQVESWVQRHRGFKQAPEEVGYYVNRAFEKMWASLTPDRFTHFSDLKALLKYLQMCTFSAVVDHLRLRALPTVEDDDHSLYALPTENTSVEDEVVRQVDSQALRRLIRAELRDERERLVAYYTFFIGLKPRELYERCPDRFASVHDIYVTKQNVLNRLRRNPDLARWAGVRKGVSEKS